MEGRTKPRRFQNASVLEQTSLDDFLTTAALAQQNFDALRGRADFSEEIEVIERPRLELIIRMLNGVSTFSGSRHRELSFFLSIVGGAGASRTFSVAWSWLLSNDAAKRW